MEHNLIICQNCGQENTAISNFCRMCGRPLKEAAVLQPRPAVKPTPEPKPELPIYVFMKQLKPGITLKFGSYEQNNGEEPEKTPISWRVLTVSRGKALLISEKILEPKPYNTERMDITWEYCSLRQWLNGEFYEKSFTQTQKNTIVPTVLSNHGNLKYGTTGGNDTEDKVFLLSFDEAEKYFSCDLDREAQGSSFAKRKGLFFANKNNYLGNSRWWLRSPGGKQDAAGSVYYSGYIYYISYNVHFENIGVRPALWVTV